MAFDGIGNIVEMNGQTYSYQAGQKQTLISVGTDSYSFDNFGNISSDPNRSYVFNWNNRLVSMTKNSQITTYDYSDDGIRVKKTPPAGSTYYAGKDTESLG